MKSPYFYGIGEPWIQREQDTGVPAAAYLDLAAGLGCTAIRNWMHLTADLAALGLAVAGKAKQE